MIQRIDGQIVDLYARKIYPGVLTIENGVIVDLEKTKSASNHYLMPGFIDAHVHIESSMLVPYEFARMASADQGSF